MSNWMCDKCGATYIDVSHQEPSVLEQELEIRELKRLLKECKTPIDLLIKMNIDGINGYKLLDLLIKIDNVIGEKK